MNERITENIVRKHFQSFERQGFIIEEQKSASPRVNKFLANASKSRGGGGKGSPEFIVRHIDDANFIIVVECKADIKKHQSRTLDNYQDYAVDGSLLYSDFLSKGFDVVSLGVSGQTENELHITSNLQLKGHDKYVAFGIANLNLSDIRKKYIEDDQIKSHRFEELIIYNKKLNDLLHKYKIKADRRSLLLSGVLITLENEAFRKGYKSYKTSSALAEGLVNSVMQQLKDTQIPNAKIEVLENAYSFIKTNTSLLKDKELFLSLIDDIDTNINSFAKTYKFYDIFGEFYIEFLRYSNADKGLGIVLTPKHITELFCDIARVSKDDVIFDNCCGTGGFLISAMRSMIKQSNNDSEKEKQIKAKQIIGIEFQDDIFPLVCSNMIMNGDGRTNLINDTCFDIDIENEILKKHSPTIGFLNPPFKSQKDDNEEWEFVLNNLKGIKSGGMVVALLPMSCVMAEKGTELALKQMLLKSHTLEAVMSLPFDIFHNSKTSVGTCAVVIKAHKPHPANYETYFGYWKDDGFVKLKDKGRIDGYHKWEDIKKEWLTSFYNRKAHAGLSLLRSIVANEEWCYEAYAETDYSKINDEDFLNTIKQYLAYLVEFDTENKVKISNSPQSKNKQSLNTENWSWFNYEDVFDANRGSSNSDISLSRCLLIGASQNGNGSNGEFSFEIPKYAGNLITVGNGGNTGCGQTFYQSYPFNAKSTVNIITTKDMELNPYLAMFLCTIIKLEKFRYNFGRGWSLEKMKKSLIKLPTTPQGTPDWQFMEDYIKSLPYSSSL